MNNHSQLHESFITKYLFWNKIQEIMVAVWLCGTTVTGICYSNLAVMIQMNIGNKCAGLNKFLWQINTQDSVQINTVCVTVQ